MSEILGVEKGNAFARKLGFRRWYQHLASAMAHPEWTFMNYGWLDPSGKPGPALEERDEWDRYPIQMYHQLYARAGLEGRALLDVGSGRGGGASYAARYLGPSSVTGVDDSANVVALCGQIHHVDGLRYVQGDAERLPFDDASFDVVSSVEASHCFASVPRFLAGVARVLRPDGDFVFADFRDLDEIERLDAEIDAAGFEVRWREDITAGVVASLDEEEARKAAFAVEEVPPELRAAWDVFAGMKGSAIRHAFRTGETRYLAYHLTVA